MRLMWNRDYAGDAGFGFPSEFDDLLDEVKKEFPMKEPNEEDYYAPADTNDETIRFYAHIDFLADLKVWNWFKKWFIGVDKTHP